MEHNNDDRTLTLAIIAMAGALGVALAGPRVYDGDIKDGAWIGDGDGQAGAAEIASGCNLYRWTCGLIVLALLLAALA